jgi:hypothetical protein
MAPNTKQLSRIVQHLSSSDLTLSKTAFLPLTQAAKHHGEASKTHENYWDWDNECKEQETDSYWEWPAHSEEQVLSTEHIVSNVMKMDTGNSVSLQSGVESFDYWDVRSVKDREKVTQPVHCVDLSDNYWRWDALSQCTSHEALPMQVPQNYWDWKSEVDECDKYWEWCTQSEKCLSTKGIEENLLKFRCGNGASIKSGVDSFDYWDDRSVKDRESSVSSALTEGMSDVYWEWAPSVEKTRIVSSFLDALSPQQCQ